MTKLEKAFKDFFDISLKEEFEDMLFRVYKAGYDDAHKIKYDIDIEADAYEEMSRVLKTISDYFKIPAGAIMNGTSSRDLSLCRHLLIYICNKECKYNQSVISKYTKKHSSTISAVIAEEKDKYNKEFKTHYDKIIEILF